MYPAETESLTHAELSPIRSCLALEQPTSPVPVAFLAQMLAAAFGLQAAELLIH